MAVNDDIFDHQIARAIRLIRFSNGQALQVKKILRRIDKQLADLLRTDRYRNAPYSKARAKALQQQIKELMAVVHADVKKQAAKAVHDVALDAATKEVKAWQKVLPAGLDVVTPNPGLIQTMLDQPYLGGHLEEWTESLRSGDVQRTWFKVREGMLAGNTTDEIVRDVVGTRSLRYADGVREVSRRGAETFVRTAISHGANAGRQAVWAQNEQMIKSVRWVSTLDSRTSPICRDLDGQLFPVDQGPRPPAHPNCRSTTVAVLASADELGIDMDDIPESSRASMNGQVPASTTYYQWLERQSPSIQKEVLGARRYEMWKAGDITIDKFHNERGRWLTLAQLRARN